MSIETFFPSAKTGGFLDNLLGGGSKDHSNGVSNIQSNGIGGKSLKSLSIPPIITFPLSSSAFQKSETKKEYRSMDKVLRNEYEHPFSKKDFALFLENEELKEYFLFIKSVEEYAKYSSPLYPLYNLETNRAARRLLNQKNHSLLRKIGSHQADTEAKKNNQISSGKEFEPTKCPALLSAQGYVNLVSSLQEMVSKIGNTYVLGPENQLNLPESIIKTFQEVYEKAEMHPKIFEQAYFSVYDHLENGPFVEFLKQSRKIASEVPGYTVRDIALKSTPSPYSYDDFLAYLSKKGVSNDLEFLAVVLEYQKDSQDFYPQTLMQISNQDGTIYSASVNPPPSAYDQLYSFDTCSTERIPNQSALTEVKKPESMSEQEFNDKLAALSSRFKVITDTYIVDGAPSVVKILPDIQKSIIKCFQEGSTHPDLLYQPFETAASNLRGNYLQDFLSSTHKVAKLDALLESTIPHYTLTQLMNDEAPSPYSKRDFLNFVRQSDRGQFYLEFLTDLQEHEKSCKLFFDYTNATKLELNPSEDELEAFLKEVDKDAHSEPRKPDGMPASEFEAIKKILVNNAKFIFETYLFHDAKKRLLNVSTESVEYISKFLNNDSANPLIFIRERLNADNYLQNTIVGLFLKQTYEDRMSKGIAFKVGKKAYSKMEKVLIEESFAEYCQRQETAEGLDFLREVLGYVQEACPIFAESLEGPLKAPKQPSTMSDSEYLSLCLSLKSKCKAIFDKYIGFVVVPKARRPSPPKLQSIVPTKKEEHRDSLSFDDEAPKGQTAFEFLSNLPRRESLDKPVSFEKSTENHLTIPDSIYKSLMAARESEVYHPNIFSRVYDFFYTQIENKAWEGYEKYVDPAGISNSEEGEELKITIKQLAMDELPSPFSYQDYSNFLQTQLCVEAIEFLKDCYQCQIVADPLFEIRTIRQYSLNSQSLADRFIPSPLRPPDVTELVFKKMLAAHQKSFKDIVNKYVNPGSPSEVNLPVKCRKPFLNLFQEGCSHPEMLNELIEHIADMLKVNNLNKFLKQATEASANAAKRTSIEDINIRQLVLNTLPPPYSTKDFMLFLKTDGCAENLEFLLSISGYHSFASPFYPDITHDRESENFKEIKLQCRLIAETFMYPESPKSISCLTDSIKKKLRIELVKENFHPDIWRPSFEVVASQLAKDKMTKFLKKASKSQQTL